MLKEKVRQKSKQRCIPLTLTQNCFCPNISKVIQKHWKLLEINESPTNVISNKSQINKYLIANQ